MSEDPFENYPLDKESLQKWITEGMEGIHIDFKQRISISDLKSKREFVRDMISLANMSWSHKKPSYLIVGVTDSRETVDSSETIDDEATYQQIIKAFINPPIDFALRKEVFQDTPIFIFIILPEITFHVTRKRIFESNTVILEKDECWFRRGSSKYQLDPLRIFQMKYGGKVIQTEKQLREWFEIDNQKVNTLIKEEELFSSIIEKVFPLKKPTILLGGMGIGKTTLLFQICLHFLQKNHYILGDPDQFSQALAEEVRHKRLILVINNFDAFIDNKKNEIQSISPDLPLISTIRTLNWQRGCRSIPSINEIFAPITLSDRNVKNTNSFHFLKKLAYSNIEEYNVSLSPDGYQQDTVVDMLVMKSEGLPLYITEVIADIVRLNKRNGAKQILDEAYLQTLPTGIRELAMILIHRDFIATQQSSDLSSQIELFSLSLCAHFNKPGGSLGVVHKLHLDNITSGIKKLWNDTIQLIFTSPHPSDFLINIGCDLYRFSHSFWTEIFRNPKESLEKWIDPTQYPVVEPVVTVLTNIAETIDSKHEELRTIVNEAVTKTILDNKDNLTRSLVHNALDIPYASPIPDWKEQIPKTQFIDWLDNEIDEKEPTPIDKIPPEATQKMFWTLMNNLLSQLLEGEILFYIQHVRFWFDIVNATRTIQEDTKQKISILCLTGSFCTKMRLIEAGRALYSEALELVEKNSIIERLGVCYGGLADSFYYEGDIESSKELYLASLAYDELVHDEVSKNSIITIIRLTEISLSENNLDFVEDAVELLTDYSNKESDLSVKIKVL